MDVVVSRTRLGTDALDGNANLPFPLGQVLTGRQQQIQEKIEQNRRAQEETLKYREELIKSLEEGKQLALRAKEESEELKSARKQELEAQVGLKGEGSLFRTGPWRRRLCKVLGTLQSRARSSLMLFHCFLTSKSLLVSAAS